MAKAKADTTTTTETKDKAAEETKPEETQVEKDPVAETYAAFRTKHTETDLPDWAELNSAIQALWRDGYNHVASGGEPRTTYEHMVQSSLAPAQ